jgi:protein-S-isoprenylcysteine O-methyltransferase Ste14
MVAFGNLIFHHRNWLFPIFYLLLFIPSPEILGNPMLALGIGLAISALGQLIRNLTIGLVYIIRGGKDRQIHANELYTKGMMAHCRNPLYVGNVLVLLGLGIAANSLLFLVIIFPIFFLFYEGIIRAEENYLEGRFGESYLAYKKQVNRWLPNLSGLSNTFSTMQFKWARVIVAEYNPMYLWMTAGVLLAMKHYITHPESYNFEAALPVFIGILVALLALYLTARYLKKSKILTSE